MTEDPRVDVIDDDHAVLESLRALVQGMNLRVECHASPRAFLETINPSRPGCLVADLRMPGMSGLELQEALSARGIPLPIIILTGHGDISKSVRAMKQGAINFLEKPCRPEILADAIREALGIATRRYRDWERRSDFEARLKRLNPEERSVFAALVRGMTIPEIAAAMNVSERTVQFRRARLMEKMGAGSRRELLSQALEFGWRPSAP